MSVQNNFIVRYPIVTFILLAFFISHIVNPIVVEFKHIVLPGFSFDFREAQLNERSLINQYGGTISALLITLKLHGVNGIRSMLGFSRITGYTVFWLFISVLMPLIMILLSYLIAGVGFGTLLTILQSNFLFYLLIIAGFIISAGLAEEFGWRGFLLPQLLKTQKPLAATFIVFFIISIWHFPALLSGWKNEPMWPWLILALAISIVHSWLFFKSVGNLWVVIMFHACFDAQYSFFSEFITGVANGPFHQGWTYVILYSIFSLIIVVATKGTLGYDKAKLHLSAYFGEDKLPSQPGTQLPR